MSKNETAASPFFANAVHELRTPIQTIIGTLELMEDTTLSQEQTEYVRQVKFSADILLALVNDLLDFSKIQSGQFKLENIPLNPQKVLEETVDLISIEAHNRGLEIITNFEKNIPFAIYSDPTRIQQILLNLVKNAVKFTSSGYVQAQISVVEKNLLFEVIDSGIGVPEEKKQLIFKEFCQADASTTRKFGGTGLGLSICKNLVALMNGEIGIRDNPEGGSVFWFTIPIEECETPPESIVKLPKLLLEPNTKILLVDDNKLALESMVKKLKFLGLNQIDVALSGDEALDKLRQASSQNQSYAIALVDMVMPVMDGWRLAAEINADRAINDVKLFMLVPEGQMGSEAKMKMLDWFNGYIYKPIKYRLLIEVLNASVSQNIDLETVEKLPEPVEIKEKTTTNESFDCTVLIAEDHPINQKLLKTFLSSFGCTVYTANNGREAVNQIAEHPEVEVVFMDVQMPELNGVEATIEIRNSEYKGIIVACTANSDEADFEMYKTNGMNDILIKPFKKQSVKDMLDKWISVIKSTSDDDVEDLEEVEEVEEVEEIPEELEVVEVEEFISTLWDTSDFLDTVSNDYGLAEQLIEQFINQTRTYLITAKEALYMKNIQSIIVIGHTLKGSSATISAKALSEAAREIENAGKAMDVSLAANYVNEFSALFTKFEYLAKDQLEEWKKQK